MINPLTVYDETLARYNKEREEEGQPPVDMTSRQIAILIWVLTNQINHQLNLKQDK